MSLVFSAYGLRDAWDEQQVRAGVEDALAGRPDHAWRVVVSWSEQFEAYDFRMERDGELLASPEHDWMISRLPQSFVENVVPQNGRSQLRQAIFDKVRMLTRSE